MGLSYRPAMPGYTAWGIGSLESILGLLKSLKIRALAGRYDNPIPTRFLVPHRLFKNSSTGIERTMLWCATRKRTTISIIGGRPLIHTNSPNILGPRANKLFYTSTVLHVHVTWCNGLGNWSHSVWSIFRPYNNVWGKFKISRNFKMYVYT
jgi:hypothetical protein